MRNLMKAIAATALMATTAVTVAPVYAQPSAPDRGDHRGDRGGRDWDRGDRGGHDRGDRGHRGGRDRDWDRGDRGGHRGGHRGHDGDVGEAIVGGIIGGALGSLLHGENYNYRFRYDDDYYSRRGYGRDHYDRWRNRDRGYGCSVIGYHRGCRTVYYSPEFIILNIRGDIFCYRRDYRHWRNTYCPREWYRY